MKYFVAERNDRFDEKVFEDYLERVQVMTKQAEVWEAQRWLGRDLTMEIYGAATYDMRNDLTEGIVPYEAINENRQKEVYGFKIYDLAGAEDDESVLDARIFMMSPLGKSKYFVYVWEKWPKTDLYDVGLCELERQRKIMQEILRPIIQWMGGTCDLVKYDSNKHSEIAVAESWGRDECFHEGMLMALVYTEACDCCRQTYWIDGRPYGWAFPEYEFYRCCLYVELALQERTELPDTESELGRFWARYFQLKKWFEELEWLKESNSRVQLEYIGDVIKVRRGYYDECFVEATWQGLERIDSLRTEFERPFK